MFEGVDLTLEVTTFTLLRGRDSGVEDDGTIRRIFRGCFESETVTQIIFVVSVCCRGSRPESDVSDLVRFSPIGEGGSGDAIYSTRYAWCDVSLVFDGGVLSTPSRITIIEINANIFDLNSLFN